MIGLFASLAIFISCLGILGLAIFSSESRKKEIGVRKVHGAHVSDILLLLNKDYLKGVFISLVFACPIAWWVMNKWLQSFAYRTVISWWLFLTAGGLAITIALLTVFHQALKAATANPVESLRYE